MTMRSLKWWISWAFELYWLSKRLDLWGGHCIFICFVLSIFENLLPSYSRGSKFRTLSLTMTSISNDDAINEMMNFMSIWTILTKLKAWSMRRTLHFSVFCFDHFWELTPFVQQRFEISDAQSNYDLHFQWRCDHWIDEFHEHLNYIEYVIGLISEEDTVFLSDLFWEFLRT